MNATDPGDLTSKLIPQPFLVGSRWSLQTWIAITGVGFGLTGHGFSEAYTHLFDWWCSRRAHSSTGLDYARYLNTQPRAPVLYGLRGFPAFSTLRYFIMALSAALSISYKFGFEQIYVVKTETVNNTILEPVSRSGNMTALGSGSETLPWLSDIPQYPYNRQFLHKPADLPDDYALDEQGWGSFAEHKESWQRSPPQLVVMVEEDQTSGKLRDQRSGDIISREIVMIASLKEQKSHNIMTDGDNSWHRVTTPSTQWFSSTSEAALVGYRVPKAGTVQIQWARQSNLTDSTMEATRVTYDIRYGVAEVSRLLDVTEYDGNVQDVFGLGWGLRVLAMNNATIPTSSSDASIGSRQYWIDGYLSEPTVGVQSGVSVIVHAAMAGWSAEGSTLKTDGLYLRALEPGDHPFGVEDATPTRRVKELHDLEYPIHSGWQGGHTGCYVPVAGVVFSIGLLSIATAIARLWIGPPFLTSWTGQHVYLSQAGLFPNVMADATLESGYDAAPSSVFEPLRWKPGAGS